MGSVAGAVYAEPGAEEGGEMTGPSDQPIVRAYIENTAGTGECERYRTADGREWRKRQPGDEQRTGVTLGVKHGMAIREEQR